MRSSTVVSFILATLVCSLKFGFINILIKLPLSKEFSPYGAQKRGHSDLDAIKHNKTAYQCLSIHCAIRQDTRFVCCWFILHFSAMPYICLSFVVHCPMFYKVQRKCGSKTMKRYTGILKFEKYKYHALNVGIGLIILFSSFYIHLNVSVLIGR